PRSASTSGLGAPATECSVWSAEAPVQVPETVFARNAEVCEWSPAASRVGRRSPAGHRVVSYPRAALYPVAMAEKQRKSTRVEDVYEHVRRDLLASRYEPGQWLRLA